MDKAAIPINDTGFTRSDATYDVVAVWHGQFFRLDDHLERFERSWNKLRMRPPLSRGEMQEVVCSCVAKSGLREAHVEMIVTRGVPVNGDRDTRNFENRFYAFATPYVWIAKPEVQKSGISLVVATGTKRIPTDSVDPTVKNFHWGDLVQGSFEAYDREAYTAVLLDAAGNVTEGPGFNVFAYYDGGLITPSRGVLQGITRATVIDLAEEHGIACAVADLSADRLRDADEIFLTSTAGGVMPVKTIDGKVLSNGIPGPVTTLVRELYWQAHERAEWSLSVNYAAESLDATA